jgi:hypothetical protein
MHILNWLGNMVLGYGIDAGIILLLAGVIYYLIKKGSKSRALEIAKWAVVQAERLYKSETGQLKKNEAVNWLREHSIVARLFLSEKDIDILIEKAWEWLNDQLTTKEKVLLLGNGGVIDVQK